MECQEGRRQALPDTSWPERFKCIKKSLAFILQFGSERAFNPGLLGADFEFPEFSRYIFFIFDEFLGSVPGNV